MSEKTLLQRIESQLDSAERIGLQACAFDLKDTYHLRDLIHAAIRFRNTAVVDDDFSEVRDRFDKLLLGATNERD